MQLDGLNSILSKGDITLNINIKYNLKLKLSSVIPCQVEINFCKCMI